jgi:hypothetical protein
MGSLVPTVASTNTAEISHPPSWKPPITLKIGDQPPAESSQQQVSGHPGAVQKGLMRKFEAKS